MYSKSILAALRKKEISVGDRIKLLSGGMEFTGLLMPRPYSGDADIVVVKLDTGYNTGLKVVDPNSIELIEKTGTNASGISTNPGGKKKTDAAEKPKTNPRTLAHGLGSGDPSYISILGCGGTIASKIEYRTGAVYPSITPSELRQAFPALEGFNIKSRQIFSLFSEDMNAHHWKLLADAIEDEIKSGSEGVVVMHGTDTMAYTSAAMSFVFQNLPVPVVFVGSQRSSDRPSSENEMNLMNSVFAARQDFAEVSLCMHATSNDDFCYIHRGNRVRKMHTSSRDAFHSINLQPLFAVDYRSNKFEPFEQPSTYRKRPAQGQDHPKMVCNKDINDNVALIYVHPNLRPDLIKRLDNYDGVVLVGTGLGHVPTSAFEDKSVKSILGPVSDLINSGIPVVMSSQCLSGRVCMRVYTNGRLLMDAGVIGDGADWTPETAYVKLCWALGQTKNMNKIRDLMMTNLAGEITERSVLAEV